MTRPVARPGLDAVALILVVALVALGVWQVERRTGKLALIAQVERRLAAPPVPAPGPAGWRGIAGRDAYTRVVARGRFVPGRDTLVQAVTDLGGGYWVMTPLATNGGWTLLVNRGFLPADRRAAIPPPPPGPVAVTGLLRLTEPGGGFLRSNAPQAGRWYSRDVAAIARSRALPRPAPYFVDADRGDGGWPRGGLTVVRFANNHLVYALTWFALAVMVAAMALRRRRGER